MIDYVALTIKGESLIPEDVTRRLGVEPSRAFSRGDTIVHPTPTRFGYWRKRVDRPGGELNGFLQELLDDLAGHELDIVELARTYETEITIVADLTNQSEGELTISGSILKRVAATSAELRFYWLYGKDRDVLPKFD